MLENKAVTTIISDPCREEDLVHCMLQNAAAVVTPQREEGGVTLRCVVPFP